MKEFAIIVGTSNIPNLAYHKGINGYSSHGVINYNKLYIYTPFFGFNSCSDTSPKTWVFSRYHLTTMLKNYIDHIEFGTVLSDYKSNKSFDNIMGQNIYQEFVGIKLINNELQQYTQSIAKESKSIGSLSDIMLDRCIGNFGHEGIICIALDITEHSFKVLNESIESVLLTLILESLDEEEIQYEKCQQKKFDELKYKSEQYENEIK